MSWTFNKNVRLKPLETLELNVFLNNNTGKETMRVTFGFQENVSARGTGSHACHPHNSDCLLVVCPDLAFVVVNFAHFQPGVLRVRVIIFAIAP